MKTKKDDLCMVIDSIKEMLESNFEVKVYIYAFPLEMSRQTIKPIKFKMEKAQ